VGVAKSRNQRKLIKKTFRKRKSAPPEAIERRGGTLRKKVKGES